MHQSAIYLSNPRQPQQPVLVHDVPVLGRDLARLGRLRPVGALDLGVPVPAVVPRLPIDPVQEIVLCKPPEERHVGHVQLLREQSLDHGRVDVVRRRVLDEGGRADDEHEDAVDEELTEGGLHVELFVAVVLEHLAGGPHA